MGRAVFAMVMERDELVLAGGLEATNTPHIGADLGTILDSQEIGAMIYDDPLAAIAACKPDAIIDFSTPAASVELATLAAQARIIDVIGTSGFDDAQQAEINAASRHATIIQDGNMSYGIAVLTELVRKLAILVDGWDVEIIDLHHRDKVDVPSGTVQKIHAAIAQARGDDSPLRARGEGIIGARPMGDIFFASLRGGGVVGEHEIMFLHDDEQIRITHRAENRDIFASGALRAALIAHQNKVGCGMFTMLDMVNILQAED